MPWQKPEPALVWRAIASYLTIAYDGPSSPHGIPASTPSAVKSRLESLRLAPASVAEFFASPVFERDSPASPTRFSLRLGNRHYPHMKLVIERSPDARRHLFRADTHDAHCCPAPGTRDYFVFSQLMNKNREVAAQIEAAWDQEQITTFKAYLRDDLARRDSKKASG